MKRMLSFLLALAAIITIAPTTSAQTSNNPNPYIVQPGDTGWALAKEYYNDPAMWNLIVSFNSMLQQPGRVFEKDDKIILLLKPGEELFGFERLEKRFNVAPPVAVSLEQLVKAETAEPPAKANSGLAWWQWMLLTLLGLMALGAFLDWRRRRELRRDPVTSGPAMVPGGIASTETVRLSNFLDQQAINRYAERNPTADRSSIQATRIGPIEAGTITGEGLVGYLGGTLRPRRIEQPLDAYRARYRFPDNTEEDLITLQACMNPVSYGNGDTYRGFTFAPRATAVPTPEPERPAPQPVPLPAMAARMIRTAAGAEGNTTVTIGDRVLVFERGVHLNVNDETGAIGFEGAAFTMTLEPKKRGKQPRTETRRGIRTGTGGD